MPTVRIKVTKRVWVGLTQSITPFNERSEFKTAETHLEEANLWHGETVKQAAGTEGLSSIITRRILPTNSGFRKAPWAQV